MNASRDLGLGHEAHPLLGRRVRDTSSGQTGVLRAIAPEEVTQGGRKVHLRRAWILPEGGGREWTTAPDAIEEADR